MRGPFIALCLFACNPSPSKAPSRSVEGITLADPPKEQEKELGITSIRPLPAMRDTAPNIPESAAVPAKIGSGTLELSPEDAPLFQGDLPPEAIKQVINDNKMNIRRCYERALQYNQHLHGRVVVTWTIGTDGAVTEAAVKSSTMANASVESCVVGETKTWKFPVPTGKSIVEVSYPYEFRAD